MSRYTIDITERIATTFLGTFIPTLLAAGPVDLIHLSIWQSAGIAGAAAVASLLKGILASGIGNRSSASMTKSV